MRIAGGVLGVVWGLEMSERRGDGGGFWCAGGGRGH